MAYKFSIGLALLAIQVGWLNLPWLLAFGVTLGIYLASGGWRFVRLIWLTFPRDFRGLVVLLKLMTKVRQQIRNNMTMCDTFQQTAEKHRDKVAFIFEDKCWTFQEVEYFSNKVGNYFQSIGYKKGDVVALFMENRPELVFFWLGLAKIGVISSLVNYNLRKESLAHCISIVNAKGLVYSSDSAIADAVADISSSISNTELFEFGNGSSNGLKSQNILEKFKVCSENPPALLHEKRYDDILFYIYTSGTTGLPKASVIKHTRFFLMSIAWGIVLKLSPADVLYCVLPLYHSSGGILGVGSVITCGVTVVVRRKFSASRFWDECIKYKATGALYIGELCRYLLAQPPKESDKKHSLRFMSGNGLRPQIWNEFKSRFNVPFIGEFYGATESNISLINLDSYPGAMAFLSVTVPQALPIRVFKIDLSTGELVRGPDGLCIPCSPGEIGQIAGRIEKRNVARHFDGYVNKQASQKKIAHDVMKKDDQWFLSGDSVYWDELGYLYFHDRLGDTFRWRGENVSTSEVEAVMANALGLNSVVVYGVEIPGCEGRAGMAAIEDPDDVISMEFVSKKLPDVLPPYARPVFLRVTNSVDTTGTFKFQKTRLRKEGFDLSLVKDKLFYFDSKLAEYSVLTKEIYGKFVDGEMRF
ncbi:long-chain fatty acid transport 4-like [Paramuricea clavata]|nr:long-chain fatty acid transport 4-like [Paramuricea clavata]